MARHAKPSFDPATKERAGSLCDRVDIRRLGKRRAVMTLMAGKVYQALLAAGVDQQLAQEAAEEIVALQNIRYRTGQIPGSGFGDWWERWWPFVFGLLQGVLFFLVLELVARSW
jgi:hypothetical protein